MKPRPEPKADALINANMPQADTGVNPNASVIDSTAEDITNTDPAAQALISDLSTSESEVDAALAGG
jgi:hypothetical protein